MTKRHIIQATDSNNCAVYYIDDNGAGRRMVRTAFSIATRFNTKRDARQKLEMAASFWLGLKAWRLILVKEQC